MARAIELAGFPTVTETMMPFLAERFLLDRIVGVQTPFGHAFGMPENLAMQRRISEAAIDLLKTATEPETRVDVEIEWPVDDRTAYRDWHPDEPSPIVAYNIERRRRLEEQQAERGD
jgi:hypothetical protein